MKRSVAFLVFLISFCGAAAAQTTTVTAASGGLEINGNPVNGTVTISSQGPVAVSGGGLRLPSSSGGYVTQCSVTGGAIGSGCTVPSSTLSNGGNGVLYSVLVTDSFAGKAQLLTNVSISGASWALDQYVPPSTVPTAAAFTYTTGSGAPSGGCSSTSLYADTSGSTLAFYGCKGGAWVSVGTASGSVTLSQITALGTLTNSISGTAATATNFDHTPNQCSTGSVPTGITSHGDANNCAPVSGGSTPDTSPTCSGTQALSFSTSGDIAYNVTLSANCTFSVSDAGSAGTLRKLTLIIHPAGFTSTLPVSSGSLVWSGGSPPAVSTSATTVIVFASTGVAPILGGY
ncbi:MAG TPA: hypothetical protein VMD97_02060 [Candidatus Aquilonibacter sp.]|nr:hypothetical protein [Candidatus Aquilonibacter sp.]